MDFKKKLILGRVITFVFAALILIMGILQHNDMLISMAVAIFALGIVKVIQIARIVSNPKAYETYKLKSEDERNIFIARKAYSTSFWVSVYAEVIIMIILTALKNDYASIFSYIACGQLMIYIVISLIYRNKY